jgi:hypothetical protein
LARARLRLSINLKVVKTIGISIPENVLAGGEEAI